MIERRELHCRQVTQKRWLIEREREREVGMTERRKGHVESIAHR